MEPSALGWRPLVTSWLAQLPAVMSIAVRRMIEQLIDWLVPACMSFVQRKCRTATPISQSNLVVSLLNLFDALTPEFRAADTAGIAGLLGDDKKLHTLLQSLFLFSVVWSIGTLSDTEGRKSFDWFFRKVCTALFVSRVLAHVLTLSDE
jgi:dynein heavy chain